MLVMRELSLSTEATPLARVDDRIKSIVSLALIVAVVMSSRLALPAGVFIASVLAAAVFRAPLGQMFGRLLAPLGFALVIGALRAFTVPGRELLSFNIGPWHLAATRAGAIDGAILACRVAASVGVILLLCAFTPVYRIFAVLKWMRAPAVCVEIAMLMYRYIFCLFEQAAGVVSAQKVRLGYRALGRGLASMGALAGMVIVRSMDQADKTHQAMLARGYQGTLPLGPMPALSARQWLALAGCVIGIAAMYLLAERGLP